MKKKILILCIAACMMAATTACGSNGNSGDSASGSAITTKEVDKYVKLGEYKGITATYTDVSTDISDDEVQDSIDAALQQAAKETTDENYKVKKGDTVNIDYVGKKGGKAFDGGSGEGYDLEIGSDNFIPGFEDGLVGAKKGEKKKLNLTFPENYTNQDGTKSDLAGEKVVFNVTINSITVVPELDEAFVTENTEYTTVDEYKASIRTQLEDSAKTDLEESKASGAWAVVLENAEIKEYPQSELDAVKQDVIDWYTQYASMFGMDLDNFITQSGSTREDFDAEIDKSAKSEVATRLVVLAISKKEKMELSDTDFEEGLERLVKQYQYSSKEDLLKDVDEETVRKDLLRQKIQKYVVDNVQSLTVGTDNTTGTEE